MLRDDHQREIEIQQADFKTKAKTLSNMYMERMKASIDKTGAAYEEQIKEDIKRVQNQCAEQLTLQIETFKSQMDTCSQSVDKSSDLQKSLI